MNIFFNPGCENLGRTTLISHSIMVVVSTPLRTSNAIAWFSNRCVCVCDCAVCWCRVCVFTWGLLPSFHTPQPSSHKPQPPSTPQLSSSQPSALIPPTTFTPQPAPIFPCRFRQCCVTSRLPTHRVILQSSLVVDAPRANVDIQA